MLFSGLVVVGGGGSWWVVVVVVVGRITSKIFYVSKIGFFYNFFFKQVQLIGGTIFFLAPTRQY